MPFFNIPGGDGSGTNSFPVLQGDGAPSDSIGADGQLYIDRLNGVLFVKDAGTWGGGISVGIDEWSELNGKPAEFPPAAHGHVIADVDQLQAALDGKQPLGEYAAAVHAHEYAGLVHVHEIADVSGLDAALSGKADAIHVHEIAAVNGLQTALDNLAAGGAGVAWSEVPATPTTTADAGSIAYNSTHLFVAVAADTWKRLPLSDWVLSTISITQQPTNQTAAAGAATFTVAATLSGGGSISYQWQTSADAGDTWAAITGATAATIELTGLTVADDGRQYRVVVSATGATSVTSNAATLTVANAPGGDNVRTESGDFLQTETGEWLQHDGITVAPITITASPQNTTASDGGAATFSVTATASDGIALRYQWQRTEPALDWVDGTLPYPTAPGGTAAIAYGNGIFVSVGRNVAATSADGSTWTQQTIATEYWWRAIAYGDGIFVAVGSLVDGSGGNAVAISSDGANWTLATLPANELWLSIVYGNNLFAAVAFGNGVYTSPDGITWTQRLTPAVDPTQRTGGLLEGLGFGNGRFIAYQTNADVAFYSDDGLAWTLAGQLPAVANWRKVIHGNGLFVVAASGNAIATSEDGLQWTLREIADSSFGFPFMAFGNGIFVAVQSFGGQYATSFDGIAWTLANLPPTLLDNAGYAKINEIAYGNNVFVSVHSSNTSAVLGYTGTAFVDIAEATAATLELSSVTLADHARLYRVVVDADGIDPVFSSTALLTVVSPLVDIAFTQQPNSQTFTEGQELFLRWDAAPSVGGVGWMLQKQEAGSSVWQNQFTGISSADLFYSANLGPLSTVSDNGDRYRMQATAYGGMLQFVGDSAAMQLISTTSLTFGNLYLGNHQGTFVQDRGSLISIGLSSQNPRPLEQYPLSGGVILQGIVTRAGQYRVTGNAGMYRVPDGNLYDYLGLDFSVLINGEVIAEIQSGIDPNTLTPLGLVDTIIDLPLAAGDEVKFVLTSGRDSLPAVSNTDQNLSQWNHKFVFENIDSPALYTKTITSSVIDLVSQ